MLTFLHFLVITETDHGCQPYDFEPHRLCLISLWPLFIWQIHALVLWILQQPSCSKCKINGLSLFVKHSWGAYFSTQITRDIVERYSYRTPPSLSVSRNILLQQALKPLAVSLFAQGSQISKPYFPSASHWHSIVTWFTSFLFFIFYQNVSLQGVARLLLPDS